MSDQSKIPALAVPPVTELSEGWVLLSKCWATETRVTSPHSCSPRAAQACQDSRTGQILAAWKNLRERGFVHKHTFCPSPPCSSHNKHRVWSYNWISSWKSWERANDPLLGKCSCSLSAFAGCALQDKLCDVQLMQNRAFLSAQTYNYHLWLLQYLRGSVETLLPVSSEVLRWQQKNKIIKY